MRLSKIIIFILALFLSGAFSACENEPSADIEYVQISGISINLDSTELDLKGKNITDISDLYNLDDLVLVDLRDNAINQDDVIDFINARPDCQILWSVPIGNVTFDNTADTIYFADSDKLDITDAEDIIERFEDLGTIQFTSLNITASDYHRLKSKYPQTEFRITVIVCDKRFDGEFTVIDLSDCDNIDEGTLIDGLAYFNEVNTVLFGDRIISDELKNSLVEKYPDTEFEWKIPLLNKEYLSTTAKIDISENEILDFEAFKNLLKYFSGPSNIDMCDCGLTNIQMEELILLYPEVKFVWKIRVGSWEMRTDVKAFGTCYEEEFEGGNYVGGAGSSLEDEEVMNLKYCKDLVALDIGHQYNINNFSFLEELTNIKYLIVALSDFEDLCLIADMKELEYLEIFNTNVSDLSPLLELPNLKYLNCSQTLITNVDYLVDLEQLEVLWLCNAEHISRDEVTRLEASLPDCYINTLAWGSTREGWRSYDNQGYLDMRKALNMPLSFR